MAERTAVSVVNWCVRNDLDSGERQAAILGDDKLLEAVAAGNAPATLRIWQTDDCIAVPRHFKRRDGFDAVAQTLAGQGWPIVLRSSGGSAMPQGSGVVNVSMVLPHEKPMSIDAGFQLLVRPLCEFLENFGLAASVGAVPGSFCDGRFNLVVDGRKIAGTAQKRTKHALLSHAALQVDLDLGDICDAINRLYEGIQRDEPCDAATATTMAAALGRRLAADRVRQRLVAFFERREIR